MKKAKQYTPFSLKSKKFSSAQKQNKHKAMYDSKEWNVYRFRFLHHNPNCYACDNKANHVDHIEPHKGDEALFWRVDNFMALCHSCHSIVTARFDRQAIPDIAGKMEWLRSERLKRKLTTRIKVVPLKK